jgi:hypothetical protein
MFFTRDFIHLDRKQSFRTAMSRTKTPPSAQFHQLGHATNTTRLAMANLTCPQCGVLTNRRKVRPIKELNRRPHCINPLMAAASSTLLLVTFLSYFSQGGIQGPVVVDRDRHVLIRWIARLVKIDRVLAHPALHYIAACP